MMKRFSQPLKYVTVVLSAVLLVCIVWRVSLGQTTQGGGVVSQPFVPEWLAICAIGGVGCAVGYALIRRLHLHRASFPLFKRDVYFHTYCILAFASVLMTYFGVNHLLGGLHSYGG